MGIIEQARKTLDTIPEGQRFSARDAEILVRHRELLLSLEDDLVQGFYDTIQSNSHMAPIISGGGGRSDREATLRRWWQRTLAGPFDDRYWGWQSLVGVVHIKVGVKNPMMMGMWTWVLEWLPTRATPAAVGSEEAARELLGAIHRLALATQAIIAESYLDNYLETVIRLTGFKPALLERMFNKEINSVLAEARAELGAI
jgi:hypothetical protein